jgi:hypothetical protein
MRTQPGFTDMVFRPDPVCVLFGPGFLRKAVKERLFRKAF